MCEKNCKEKSTKGKDTKWLYAESKLKRKRNAEIFESLGFKDTSPKSRSAFSKMLQAQILVPSVKLPSKSNIIINRKKASPKSKINPKHKQILPKLKPKPQRQMVTRKPRTIFTNYSKKLRCKCDHKD